MKNFNEIQWFIQKLRVFAQQTENDVPLKNENYVFQTFIIHQWNAVGGKNPPGS